MRIALAAKRQIEHFALVDIRGLTPEERVEYRQLDRVLKWNRMLLTAAAIICVAWSIIVIIDGYWFWMPIAMALLASIGLMTRRIERLAIVADGDQLLVTNVWRDYRFRRGEIASFAIEATFMNRRPTIRVKLKDFTSVSCNVRGPYAAKRPGRTSRTVGPNSPHG